MLPAEEDFGIAPVEAMASGRPVVALALGGATETVVAGETGLLVDDQDETAFAAAMDRVRETTWDTAALAQHAARFSPARFDQGLRETLTRALTGSSPC